MMIIQLSGKVRINFAVSPGKLLNTHYYQMNMLYIGLPLWQFRMTYHYNEPICSDDSAVSV